LPSPSGGEGIIDSSSPSRGEGWERVKCKHYFETVNNYEGMRSDVLFSVYLTLAMSYKKIYLVDKRKVIVIPRAS
jgi:hypothetical protein